MAKRNDTCVVDYILKIYRGISVRLPFTYEDDDEVGIDLTGKSIIFKLKFGNVVLTYTDTPNSYGSRTTVTDAVNGEFEVLIANDETIAFSSEYTTGSWWIEIEEGGESDLLYKGQASVEDL